LYITYLAKQFVSTASVKNYVSGINFLHKCLAKTCVALQQFPVTCLLRAIDIDMRRLPLQKLPITPLLLLKLVGLSKILGHIAPHFKVAILFAFFGMLRVSNLAPLSAQALDSSRDMCRSDVLLKPPGVVLVLKWSKTLQVISTSPLVLLPAIPGHQLDPVSAYKQLLAVAPASSPSHPLLMYVIRGKKHVLSSQALNRILHKLLFLSGLNPRMYSFHSCRRGGATAAYHAGVKVNDIKRHGIWSSDSFFKYVKDPVVALSPVAHALAGLAVQV
jgi:hypothetical protein